MTPKSKEELEKRIYGILQYQFLGPLEPTEADVDEAYGDIMVIFYSELEQAAREELENLKRYWQKEKNEGGFCIPISSIDSRIAELQSTIKEDKSK